MKSVRLIVGCGYVGTRVASRWLANGDRVLAITRTKERAAELREAGIEPIVWNWQSETLPSETPPVSLATLLVSVSHSPPPGQLPETAHAVGLENLRRWMRSQDGVASPQGNQTASPRWVYLSTTGVFAPTGSVTKEAEWVDESSAVGPVRPGSIAALGGEAWVNESLRAEEVVILRPAGIYGPDRVPRWEAIRDQKPLEVDPASYLNLIHVDDLVTTILAVADQPTPSSLYCVSDGHSPTRKEYYEWISQVMELPPPVFAVPSAVPTAAIGGEPMAGTNEGQSIRNRPISRSDSNKRVSNRKLVAELNPRFQYLSFRQGLSSLVHPQ